MHALLDGDIFLYRAAFSVESRMYIVYRDGCPLFCSDKHALIRKWVKENEHLGEVSIVKNEMLDEDCFVKAKFNLNSMIKSCLAAVKADTYELFLTGTDNFRHDIYPEYKAGRPPKPRLYPYIRKLLEDDICTEVVDGMEADDAMAIAQTEAEHESYATVICSIDKDLLMVKGHHYNFVKREKFFTNEHESNLRFYTQLLTGDSVDNIPGLKGIGPVRAGKMLEGCTTKEHMYEEVRAHYARIYSDLSLEEVSTLVLENGRLLWMVRELDSEGKPVMWRPPC